MNVSSLVRLGTLILLVLITAGGTSAQELSFADNFDGEQTSLLDRPARLDVTAATLPDALIELRRRAGIPLVFSESLLPEQDVVSCACTSGSVRQALDRLLAGTGLTYTELRTQIVIEPSARRAALREPAPLVAQDTAIIRGVVRDQAGAPVLGASVMISRLQIGTITDRNGGYVLVVPARLISGQEEALVARSLGYRSEERPIRLSAGTQSVDFALEISALSLDAVVVTGMTDEMSARRVPFTIARIGEADLEVPQENALASLQGRVAGANIVSGGAPGTGLSLLLRSPTSLNKTTFPLVVVDGVILSNFTRSTADLDALDIESIEVVKGAAAASLYGSRAANGVIQIRTRRGSSLAEGTTQMTARAEIGRSSIVRDIARARHHHFLTNASGEYVNAQGAVVSRENRVERPFHEGYLDVPYRTPLGDPLGQLFNPGSFNNYSATIARNAGDTNFFLSLGNQRTGGVVLESGGYDRNDVRLNLDHSFRDDLRISVSAFHMRSERDVVQSGIFSNLVQQAPDVDLLQPDPDGTPFLFRPDSDSQASSNPLYRLFHTTNDESRVRTLASAELRYTPTPWMSIESNVSYDRFDRLSRFYYPREVQTDVSAYNTGAVRRTDIVNDALNGWLSASFRGHWRDLSARATLRGLFESERAEQFNADGTGLTVAATPTLDASTNIVSGMSESDVRSNGYFFITGLDYDGRYILDGLVRRDGSSLFGPDERWHTYYRISGAYRMAEEAWWPFPLFDEFKLRASRGTAGGRPSFQDQYETLSFGDAGGFRRTTLGNRSLKPERATEQEVGLDMIVGPVSLQLTYAEVETVDQLVRVPISGITGFAAQWRNAGTVQGNTFEASLEALVLDRNSLRWTTGLVFDRSRNEITEYNSNCFRTGPANIGFHCAGETLGTMYGGRFLTSPDELPADVPAAEFDVNDDGLLVWVGPNGSYRDRMWGESVTMGGQSYAWGMPVMLRDDDGNPIQTKIGDSNPDFRLGFSNRIGWRGFSLYGLVDTQVGGNVYNGTRQRMVQHYRAAETDQAGKPEENKKVVGYYDALYGGNNLNSWFVEPGGYVKLRELSLRYSTAASRFSALDRFGIDRVTLSLSGRNLMSWTDYTGFDPEVGHPTNRYDDFDYPHYRTVTASVQLQF